MTSLIRVSLCLTALVFSNLAVAKGGGGGSWALGGYLGSVNASQDSLNLLQKRANTREGGISTPQLTQGYELAVGLTYRFTGTLFAVHFRPSFFYQRADGQSSTGGSFTYGVQGYTFFPMLRLYPLENDFMRFYMQMGLGYGQAYGTINEGYDAITSQDRHVDFSSGSFGTTIGLGAEFCLTANHCFAVEGDYRYLNFTRNVASKGTNNFGNGTGPGGGDSLSQGETSKEVELDDADVEVRMGGLMFLAGYSYWF